MNLNLETISILLLFAAIVAMFARRFHFPYSIGLVIAGIGLTFFPFLPDIELSKELIFNVFLPPLVFEAALFIRWHELKRDAPVILSLATLGLLLAAGLTAFGMHLLAGWEWSSAIVFGVLISATDPVSVIATFKEARVHGRLRLLVEAESLLNDGMAAVAFTVALALALGGHLGPLEITVTLLQTILGGVLSGAVVSGLVLLLAGRTSDHLVEITFSTIAAYGSFLIAEHFHVSGVLAALTSGLIIGNLGHLGSISKRGREALESFWEYVTFVVNSLIFILIGLRVAHQNFGTVIVSCVIAIVFVTLGRAMAVYPLSALFSRSTLKVSMPHQHVLFWGGLRGALALALALGLPPEMPRHNEIITVAFAVVAFSLFAQGLTMTPLLRYLKQLPPLVETVRE
jgi:monovalent cation:H+ antiporter, CPA1 family